MISRACRESNQQRVSRCCCTGETSGSATPCCCSPPRELDLRILQDALAREAAEEAADQAAREAKRQEVRGGDRGASSGCCGVALGWAWAPQTMLGLELACMLSGDGCSGTHVLQSALRACSVAMRVVLSACVLTTHGYGRPQVLQYRHQLALSMQREALAKGEQDSFINEANREKQAAQV